MENFRAAYKLSAQDPSLECPCDNQGLVLITDTHTETNRLKWDFWIQETSKRVNPSKSLLRKFDPQTILSVPFMDTKK